jgi:hypothetical protein
VLPRRKLRLVDLVDKKYRGLLRANRSRHGTVEKQRAASSGGMIALRPKLRKCCLLLLSRRSRDGVGEPMFQNCSAIVIAWIVITAIPSVDAYLGWLIIAIVDRFHKPAS